LKITVRKVSRKIRVNMSRDILRKIIELPITEHYADIDIFG